MGQADANTGGFNDVYHADEMAAWAAMNAPVPVGWCGTPAIPTEIWVSWNLDPRVMLALAGLAAAIWFRTRGAERGAGLAGTALLAVIFLSPLCALSAALFSARVVHHVLLIAGVAPLLALAFPARQAVAPGALFVVHLAVVWLWHVPPVYAFGVGSVAGYWLMQASLLAVSLALWREILRPGSDTGTSISVLLGTVAQMGLLGALITFAPRPLFPAHLYSTEAWGFSPLEDQQLAGLIMWVPAILPYLAAALVIGIGRIFPPQVSR